MKGSRAIFALLAVVFCLTAFSAWASQEYMEPVNKTGTSTSVLPPTSYVRYNTILYTFRTNAALSVGFRTIDASHVELTVKAISPTPYYDISVQWYAFPPCLLEIGGDGNSSFILNTETGYAEK